MGKLLPITYKLVMEEDGSSISHVEVCQGDQKIKLNFSSAMMSGRYSYRWSTHRETMDKLAELVHDMVTESIGK